MTRATLRATLASETRKPTGDFAYGAVFPRPPPPFGRSILMTPSELDPLRPHEASVETPSGGFDAGLWFVGRIRTPWTRRADCPKRGDPENGPICRIEIFEPWLAALAGVETKERLQILYWMHLSRRDVVLQNPDFGARSTGTFALRSPLRPNPIASSVVRLIGREGAVLQVRGLDCLDETPLIDLKPEFGAFSCAIS